ncbi:MAG: Rrf2 family transcriptional regulator [Planctomycetaceae bacterium]|nr:Rrf2 family transcriptional regulator [Planctomycetaceae bacterium]
MASQGVEYALRAILMLANSSPLSMNTRTIALKGGMPFHYLHKMMHKLVRAQLIVPRTGSQGGYTLARPDHRITLWDVYCAVESLPKYSGCLIEASHSEMYCPLHSRLTVAFGMMQEYLSNSTVADVLSENPNCLSRPISKEKQLPESE